MGKWGAGGAWSGVVLAGVLAVATGWSAGCGNGSTNDKLTGSSHPPPEDASTVDSTVIQMFPDASEESITIQPQNQTLTSMGPGGTQQFTAYLAGSMSPVQATWSITSGVAIGSIAATGLYTAGGSVAGTVNVQATYGNLTAQTQLQVVLDLTDNAGMVPMATQQALLAGGTADAAFAWLYPYDGTVFPRGLLPPTMQFAGTAPDATYVHVSFGSLDYKGFYGASNPGRVAFTPQMWTTITESAAASDAVQVQLTKISGGMVTGPITESWTIAQGSLKGTVYYESRYSNPTDQGATMRIKPGAAQPDVLFGGCNVCHYVSADGSTIVETQRNTPPFSSASYDLTNNGALLHQEPDESFTFGALYPDGSVLLRNAALHEGSSTTSPWEPDVPGVGDESQYTSSLYNVKTGAQIPAPGWDGVVSNALMPAFSPDGTKLAFNHYDTGMGHSLAVMDYTNATNTFANLTDVSTDPMHFLGWPTFTPDSSWLVFHTDSNADYATWELAKADLSIAHLASNTTATLDKLNGVLNGQYYLPYGEMAEGHMNYLPTILPVAVGGYYWVVFTSRREYGNTITTSDPYYATANTTPGALPWRKKLWVAALDIDNPEQPSTMAHDISHPAFYLDGQDLQTGNYRGFWALDPCQQNGISCTSGDQCCTGFCRQATGDAGVAADDASTSSDAAMSSDAGASSDGGGGPEYVCVPAQACAMEYEKCTTTASCCGAGMGIYCIAGYCATTAQ